MDALRIAAFALLLVGGLALAYGGFTYTRETHEAQLGPLELSVQDKQRVNVPVWAGVGVMALGGVLLLVRSRKR